MIRPAPMMGTPFGSPAIGTTADFITPNNMMYPAKTGMPTISTQMIQGPMMPAVNTMQTTSYQMFPPIIPAATTAAFVNQQPSVSIMPPPLSSRGLLNTGIRPMTPPIGMRPITPLLPPPSVMSGSRVIAQSRIMPTGCCP